MQNLGFSRMCIFMQNLGFSRMCIFMQHLGFDMSLENTLSKNNTKTTS
jgi:hypothetical protein